MSEAKQMTVAETHERIAALIDEETEARAALKQALELGDDGGVVRHKQTITRVLSEAWRLTKGLRCRA